MSSCADCTNPVTNSQLQVCGACFLARQAKLSVATESTQASDRAESIANSIYWHGNLISKLPPDAVDVAIASVDPPAAYPLQRRVYVECDDLGRVGIDLVSERRQRGRWRRGEAMQYDYFWAGWRATRA